MSITECPDCEDGTRWTSRYGGNDPDVWRTGPCETCDGTGQVEVCCALCGEYGATDRVGDEVFHLDCAEEVLADMHHVLEELA
jgi:hypothetical protein